MTKLGNFMVATGGRSVASRFGPSVNTIEVMSTRRPGKWRVLQKFRMPNPTHDHCTVRLTTLQSIMNAKLSKQELP